MSEEESIKAELARVRAEHRQISDLLALIQELTSRAVRSESVADLFCRAYTTLHRCVPFDVGVGVMIEQNLDLFVVTRENAESFVNDGLVAQIRRTLEQVIPVSFAHTEIVVMSETHDLPAAEVPGDALTHHAYALLEQEHRTAGVLMVHRAAPEISDEERQILTIFSTQVSMLLDTIRARERITNLADSDDLTGVWNKRHFRRQLPHEIERARTFGVPLSLLLLDIDDFKQINDVFGHVLGDVVLSELCGAVRETLRPTDIMARFGGDEFVIILPHTDVNGAKAVASRILARLRGLTIPTDDEGAIQCSVSIGIAEYRQDSALGDDLLRLADDRMYESKRAGKNRYTAE